MSEPSFGDVTGEYLALRSAAAVVRPAHEIVWVRGPAAVSFLDGLLSQDIAGIPEGGVARSFLLEPGGKLASMVWVLRGPGEAGLAADPGGGEALAAALARFRFRVEATIEAGDPASEVWGPASAAVLESAGVEAPAGWGWDDAGPVAAMPLGGLPRYLVPAAVAEYVEEKGLYR
ncbi:MAG: hypothetical protein KJ698_08555 [Actinobacteria bacterium]|nr:hypothetical protein [Actinomycetota bacterium]